MTSYITGKVSVFTENKNVDATVVLMSIESSEQIKSVSWKELTTALADLEQEKGQVQFANAWNDKPAKMVQWFKENESIRFEIWHQEKGKDWDFKTEYIYSSEDLEKFEAIHAYNVEIMKQLKKEFANESLEGTGFLTRD